MGRDLEGDAKPNTRSIVAHVVATARKMKFSVLASHFSSSRAETGLGFAAAAAKYVRTRYPVFGVLLVITRIVSLYGMSLPPLTSA
jgi:hypothetical protein